MGWTGWPVSFSDLLLLPPPPGFITLCWGADKPLALYLALTWGLGILTQIFVLVWGILY